MGAHYKGFEKFNAFNALTFSGKGFPGVRSPLHCYPSLIASLSYHSYCLFHLIVLSILMSLGAGLPAPAFMVLSLFYINTFKPLNAFIALNPYLWARVGVEGWIAV